MIKLFSGFCVLLILLFQQAVQAQPNYEEIKKNIEDPLSPSYYPDLLQRFSASDSTLTMEDFQHLYFGGVFHKNYDLQQIQEAEKLIRLANYEGDHLIAYELADSLLKEYPISIQAYFEKAYACFNLKRFDEEDFNNKRYKILIRAILSLRDGKTFDSAYHANLPNDEYETLKFLRLEYKEVSEIEYSGNSYDVFSLKPNKSKLKELYFNVSRQARVE